MPTGSEPTPTQNSRGWQHELRQLLKLSAPLAVVQVGYQLTGLVDIAFAGRLDEVSLAATGLGSSVFFAMTVVGIGVGLGIDPLVAQAFGAGKPGEARRVLWQGAYTVILLALPLSWLVLLGAGFLEDVGIGPVLAARTQEYIYARLASLCPLLLAVTFRSYLQGARLARPVVVATVVTNIMNAAANWVLVFGDEGIEPVFGFGIGLRPMGLAGLGWASVAAALAQAAYLAFAVARTRVELTSTGHRNPDPDTIIQVLKVGAPVGLHLLAEVGVFSAVQIFIGGIGVLSTAAHQVALQLASLTFHVCLGIGSATTVQVGRAVGRGDRVGTRLAGMLGIASGGVFMVIPAIGMWLAPEALARTLTNEPDVIVVAAGLVRIAGAFQIVDGLQAVAGGALRGCGITGYTFGAHLVAHWVIGLPLGLFLAFGLEWEAAGLWWGLTAGLAFVAVVLVRKYWTVTASTVEQLNIAVTSIPAETEL